MKFNYFLHVLFFFILFSLIGNSFGGVSDPTSREGLNKCIIECQEDPDKFLEKNKDAIIKSLEYTRERLKEANKINSEFLEKKEESVVSWTDGLGNVLRHLKKESSCPELKERKFKETSEVKGLYDEPQRINRSYKLVHKVDELEKTEEIKTSEDLEWALSVCTEHDETLIRSHLWDKPYNWYILQDLYKNDNTCTIFKDGFDDGENKTFEGLIKPKIIHGEYCPCSRLSKNLMIMSANPQYYIDSINNDIEKIEKNESGAFDPVSSIIMLVHYKTVIEPSLTEPSFTKSRFKKIARKFYCCCGR